MLTSHPGSEHRCALTRSSAASARCASGGCLLLQARLRAGFEVAACGGAGRNLSDGLPVGFEIDGLPRGDDQLLASRHGDRSRARTAAASDFPQRLKHDAAIEVRCGGQCNTRPNIPSGPRRRGDRVSNCHLVQRDR